MDFERYPGSHDNLIETRFGAHAKAIFRIHPPMLPA